MLSDIIWFYMILFNTIYLVLLGNGNHIDYNLVLFGITGYYSLRKILLNLSILLNSILEED